MQLYYDFHSYGNPCKLIVDYNPMAVVRPDEFYHRVKAEINGTAYVNRLAVTDEGLPDIIESIKQDLIQIAEIISYPESDTGIKWLLANDFQFSTAKLVPQKGDEQDDMKDLPF